MQSRDSSRDNARHDDSRIDSSTASGGCGDGTDREQVRDKAKIQRAGRWYIAELDDPQLAVIAETEADARDKLVKRWEDYTSETDHSDILLGRSVDTGTNRNGGQSDE